MTRQPLSLPPLMQSNPVLFGHDPAPGLISCELEGGDKIKIYIRADGDTRETIAPFEPLLLLEGDSGLQGWKGEARIEKLDGAGAFNRLALFPDLKQLEDARNHLQRKSGRTPSAADAPYWYFSDPLNQFFLLTGKTQFRNMHFGELRRLQLDIETYCQAGFEFPNASRASDRVTAIALADTTGWERLISGKDLDEPEMLRELVTEIRRRDPDVIEGHNLFRFDLEYLAARAKRHKVDLAFGRDGSRMGGHASRMQLAERSITYKKYEVHGRHIIDTWILAQHYDVATRELESFGLKDIARHFGVAGSDRVYVPGDKTSWYFDNDPATLFRYALDDVRETRAISDLLSPSYFVQAQIFPYGYQNIPLRGNATKIDALLLREYLRQRRALPRPDQGREVAGGYTGMEFQGTARRVLHCDVTSLYPSIMLAYGFLPAKDDLGVMPGLLRDLREFRVKAKELARDAAEEESRIYFNALQSTFKILINSFYGYLGFPLGRFNDFEAANRVTAKGRELIQSVMSWLRSKGARLIEVDTDGIYFVPPPSVLTEEDEERLILGLREMLPQGIDLELDGRYPAMFSYKVKNYALLDDRGRLLIKGSGLRSRGLEPFQREWLEQMLALLLKGEEAKIPALYESYLAHIDGHRKDISWLAKTETLQDSLETYQAKVKARKRNPAAPYELALQAERPYQPGDQVSYYVTGLKAKVKISEHCKLASQWDPRHPDENVEHYKAKLKDLYGKFRPFIEGENGDDPALDFSRGAEPEEEP